MNGIDWIKRHEGERLKPYCDKCGEPIVRAFAVWQCGCLKKGGPAGTMTIGSGRNLEAKGITADESEFLLTNDFHEAYADLFQFAWFRALDNIRYIAVVDLRLNVGAGRFREFVKMIAALERGDYNAAADEMLDSAWAKEVPIRAAEDAVLLRSGRFPNG
ncbi:MAG TPA: hypothetical protein VLT57_11205 [Bryobacteraceae bacterium]|nr:hypothetical protein [Bryobacteraceae bacterium]